ncbi:methyl-accepting chemotaxis protein [Curvibacter sp. HBC61]|uniref:Methyl-accepting chemotaxis protein n=1 Tax=Curvibacter cyanobacteriorum TaxID=3026422 RepID=A0ABT5MSU5_9BURK|nr:methyl-accepting chemotaxis protein [Curvibacter sp. HBC61]MDD0837123.1 methyl-accepting chemotaxis protein [Curvibacter sp. HBC61]
MQFNNLSVARRLWLTFSVLVLVMVTIAGWAQYRSNNGLTRAMEDVIATDGRVLAASRWNDGTSAALNASVAAVLSTEEIAVQRLSNDTKVLVERNTAMLKNVMDTSVRADEKQAIERLAEERKPVLAALGKANNLKKGGDNAGAKDVVEKELIPLTTKYIQNQQDFVKLLEKNRDAAVAQAQDTRRDHALMSAVTALIVAVLVLLVVAQLVTSINRPLHQAVELAQAIAAGNLTQEAHTDRRDEFGVLLNAMSDMARRLRAVVGEVRTGVDALSIASVEIANGNQDLSSRTEQTASNLQQTAASMEQLTSTVNQSADTARQANQLASTAAQAATRGGQVVGQVVTSMQHITDSSRKISDIIGVIDGIAFQTNILALNAAVEAARAGEQGRGFAVVAGEVRSLAQRSAEAAKEIKSLINASVEKVESGSQQVAEAGASMDEIVNSVRRVSDLIGEISASSGEQREGIAQVNSAVSQLDQMTQQNAALVEESAAAASSLRDQAQRLSEVVSVFNVGQGSQASHPAPAPSRPRPQSVAAAPAPRSLASAPRPAPAAAPRAALSSSAPAAPAPSPAPAKASAGSESDWESF